MTRSLVLIGSGTSTFGSGILLSYNSNRFILTTGHVVRAAGTEKLFAIPDVMTTYHPVSGYSVMYVTKINQDKNDLAICEISEAYRKIDRYPFVQIDYIPIYEPKIGDRVKLIGFPVSYTERLLALNREDPLQPFETEATIINNIIPSELEQRGFPVKISEGIVARINEKIDSKGFSGGVILRNGLFAGIIIGGIKYAEGYSDEIVFVSFQKIKQLIFENFFERCYG